MLTSTKVEWHDLIVDPDDMPGADDEVLVTIEMTDGKRIVWNNVFFDEESERWCTFTQDEYGRFKTTKVWYKVIGWAYLPAPMTDIVCRR